MGGQGSGGAHGNFGSDGSRPNGPPSKPASLSESVSSVWDRLLSELSPAILRKIDGFQLESLANLLVQSRALGNLAMQDPTDAKVNRQWLATVDLVRKLSACFGLSPSDRKRLSITDEPPEHDAYADRGAQ